MENFLKLYFTISIIYLEKKSIFLLLRFTPASYEPKYYFDVKHTLLHAGAHVQHNAKIEKNHINIAIKFSISWIISLFSNSTWRVRNEYTRRYLNQSITSYSFSWYKRQIAQTVLTRTLILGKFQPFELVIDAYPQKFFF